MIEGNFNEEACRERRINNQLLKALKESNLEKIRELLDTGVNVNTNLLPNWVAVMMALTPWRRYSPLHCAVVHSTYEVIEELIRRGANVNAFHCWFSFSSCIKTTAIELVLAGKPPEDQHQVINLLLQNGFDINLKGNFLWSELNALELIRLHINKIYSDGNPTPTAKSLKNILEIDFKRKSETIAQLEDNADNADNAGFTKKLGQVPSLFCFAAKILLSNNSLEQLKNKNQINIDVTSRIEKIQQDEEIYNRIKPKVESYKSSFQPTR